MKVLAPTEISSYIDNNDGYFFVHEEVYKAYQLSKKAVVADKWKIWKRGRRWHHILDSLKKRDLNLLQEEVYLLQKKSIPAPEKKGTFQ